MWRIIQVAKAFTLFSLTKRGPGNDTEGQGTGEGANLSHFYVISYGLAPSCGRGGLPEISDRDASGRSP